MKKETANIIPALPVQFYIIARIFFFTIVFYSKQLFTFLQQAVFYILGEIVAAASEVVAEEVAVSEVAEATIESGCLDVSTADSVLEAANETVFAPKNQEKENLFDAANFTEEADLKDAVPQEQSSLSNENDVDDSSETIEESKDSIDNGDNKERKANREYYDDNGKLYRRGDNLEPNSTFEVRGYTYKTDEHGRTISAEGKLRLKDPEFPKTMDSMEAVGKGDQKDDDDRGHLIAYQFNGSGGIENLSPMSSDLNRKDYASLEKKLSAAVKDGADVTLKVEPQYGSDSNRPTEYRVSYSIDGDRTVVVFKNIKEE